MADRSNPFPIVLTIIALGVDELSEEAVGSLKELFVRLREKSPSGVRIVQLASDRTASQVARETEGAGLTSLQLGAGVEEEKSCSTEDDRLLLHLVEMSDLALFIFGPKRAEEPHPYEALLSYAEAIDHPSLALDSRTGTLRGALPEAFKVDQDWLPSLFTQANLSSSDDLETVKARMGLLADRSAPLTRAKWNWVVFLQGLAVCVPLGWLLGFPVVMVGLAAFVTTIVLVSLHWWLRYRSMQKTWARARLVTEVARSLLATFRYPVAWPWQTFSTLPSLSPLRWVGGASVMEAPFNDWLRDYLDNRLGVQERYFEDKQKEAEKQRRKLSSWTTLLLDLALLFAVAGLVIAFSARGNEWMVGGSFAQAALGSTSILILLGLLLVQVVRELQEVNRRTARFAQQQLVLQNARNRLSRLQSPEMVMEVVADTETKLLAEVFEWYFHAETAERFVELRESSRGGRTRSRSLEPTGSVGRVAGVVPGKLGTAGLFILRVMVGRLPWIAVSAIAVSVWVSYNLAERGSDFHRLEDSVHLMASNSRDPFDPHFKKDWTRTSDAEANIRAADLRERAKHGYVVLVHGLYGRGFLDDNSLENERNWMEPCATAIERRTASQGSPAICLVNWSDAAMPSNFYHQIFGKKNLLADLPAIRAQAYRVGDIVAFNLAGTIVQNHLPTNVPFHLVGHSAGGFVVARVAARLSELGVVSGNPNNLRVSILDTPMPDAEITNGPPGHWPTDFYLTSYNVWEYPFEAVLPLAAKRNDPPANRDQGKMNVVKIPRHLIGSACGKIPDQSGFWLTISRHTPLVKNAEKFWKAHRAACCWFQQTAEDPNAKPQGQGFNDSPIFQQTDPAVTRE
jgi:pimeloyl-ACP methyl ester carboxylesterase